MLTISNVEVYDLEKSVIACRNAMRTELPEYSHEEFLLSLPRAKALAAAPSGSGHETFLSGIRVNFDIVYPNYISPELQRYHWVDIVTSSSKMHRLHMMAAKPECYNKYVRKEVIAMMARLLDSYNEACETGAPEDCYYAYMELLSNCPQGIELFMRVSTNYLQLKTIYRQRKNHKLKEDWGAFCHFVESLPFAEDFIIK